MNLKPGSAIAALSFIAAMVPAVANAAPANATCTSENHNLNATANYSEADVGHHRWGAYSFTITGAGTGGESNVIIRLRADGIDRWSRDYTSVDQDQTYTGDMGGVQTLKSAREYVLFRGIFDVFGPDPSCNAYTPTI